ncbi:MAG: TVP38/TMEM64 family protein [Pseudomonadota bacterium]
MSIRPTASRVRTGLIVAVLALVGVLLWQAPLTEWLDDARIWRQDHVVAAALAYLIFVVIGTALMLPGSILMMTGGFLFGALAGFGLAAVGVGLGATLACVIGRRFARAAVLRALEDKPVFHGLEQALRARGFLVVFLTRLSLLIPFNVLNYAYGVSSVPLSRYFPATTLGMLPAVALFSYLGSIAGDVESLVGGGATEGTTGTVVMIVGVIAMVLATMVIHRTATAELRKHLATPDSSNP